MRSITRLRRTTAHGRVLQAATLACLMSARLFLLLMLAAHAQLPMASTVTAALGVTEGSLFDAFTNEFITEILVNNKNYELDKASW